MVEATNIVSLFVLYWCSTCITELIAGLLGISLDEDEGLGGRVMTAIAPPTESAVAHRLETRCPGKPSPAYYYSG